MARSSLRYDRMVENALRGVVREALSVAAERGLPGAHHFYITFRTSYPGVDIPDFLSGQYPQDMTIVLEHQFWGLEVDDEKFGVTLSFRNQPQRLTIPLAAITEFADPSVKFGLEFPSAAQEQPEGGSKVERLASLGTPAPASIATIKAFPGTEPLADQEASALQLAPAEVASPSNVGAATPKSEESGEPSKPGEVVKLDLFRKK